MTDDASPEVLDRRLVAVSDFTNSPSKPLDRSRLLRVGGRLALLVLVIAGLGWASQELGVSQYVGRKEMRALVATYEPFGPLVFMALCIAGVFLRVPGIVLIWMGGVVFGTVRGFVYSWSACIVGTAATFLFVRYLARDQVQLLLTNRFGRLQELDEMLARNGLLTVFGLRLLLFMAPTLNWVLGVTRVSLRDYVGGTAVGLIPALATIVYLADASTSQTSLSTQVIVVGLCTAAWLVTSALVGRRLLGSGRVSQS